MHHKFYSGSGLRLITVLLVILLIVLPGVVCAETAVQNNSTTLTANTTPVSGSPAVTSQTTIPVTTNTSDGNTTVPVSEPPLILITRTDVQDFTSTVYGTVTPGTLNVTITTLRWDWGDGGTVEYHEFPYSHNYRTPATYSLSITAFQSDGQQATGETNISITAPTITVIPEGTTNGSVPTQPPGPVGPASAPVLTLLEPVIDGMNVTLNGNLNAISPGVSIESVTIDWDDGNLTEYPDLPATYQYAEQGTFTINITGKQSDGQLTTKRITVDLKADSGPPGPAGTTPPPGDLPMAVILGIILVTAVTVVVIGGFAQRVLHSRRETSASPDIPETVAIQEKIYYQAQAKGDLTTAAASAHVCAQLFRSFAEKSPEKAHVYYEMAEKWDTIARNTERQGIPDHFFPKNGGMPENLPTRQDLERICSGTDVTPEVIDAVFRVAREIAREGREGKAVGTSFVVGDTATVLNNSRQFVLNPFHGHQEKERQILDSRLDGNIKEFAQLDGAFIISGTGIVEAAGRYITVDMSQVDIPGGLGSRHSSIAGITRVTRSVGIVVSQSGGLITVFRDGKILYTFNS
jgi:hypothetical protein